MDVKTTDGKPSATPIMDPVKLGAPRQVAVPPLLGAAGSGVPGIKPISLPTGQLSSLSKAVAKRQVVRVKAQAELSNTIFIYGDSGLGKSTEAARFAMWMYEHYGKHVGLVTCETSSQKIFEPLIKIGVVDPFFLPSAEFPLAAFRKIARGLWPTGSGDNTKWIDAPLFSGYIFEGLTSISQTLLEECRDEHRLLREQKSDAFEIVDEMFGVASQSAYGFVQSEMVRAIRAIAALPNIRRNLWTGHEGFSKTKVVGAPGLVGGALTADMPKHCGLLLHFENYPEEISVTEGIDKMKTTRKKVRVWFDPHFDSKSLALQFLAKTTIPASRLPELYKAHPNGYFECKPGGIGLHEFLTLEEKLMTSQEDALTKWKAETESKLTQVTE